MTITEQIKERFPKFVIGTHAYRANETVVLKREGLVEVCRALKDEPAFAFNFLIDLSCADYLAFGKAASSKPAMTTPSPLPYFMTPKRTTETWERLNPEFRFEVVYHLFSLTKRHRVRLKVPLAAADPVVDSLTGVWKAANWYEREVWDMFGITFTGHPNLRRILMYEEFKGHPLRKDFPITNRQPLIGPIYTDPNVAKPPIIVGMDA